MDGSTESLKRRAPSLPIEVAESSSKRSASEGPLGDASSSDPRSGLEELSLDTPPNIQSSQPPQDERDLILHQISRPLVLGDVWFLIPRTWYRSWDHLDGNQLSRQDIGPIDTSSLLDGSSKLLSSLVFDVDYIAIHEQGWELLLSWYGSKGPGIPKRVIPTSSNSSQYIIELSPPEFHLTLLSKTASSSPPEIFTLSASSPYSELLDKARNAFQLPSNRPIRLWRLGTSHSELSVGTLDPSKLVTGDELVEEGIDLVESSDLRDASLVGNVIDLAVEQQDENGDWLSNSSSKEPSQAPPPFADNFFNNMGSASSSSYQPTQNGPVTRSQNNLYTDPTGKALTGLNNLGNTCYMNSAVQCLANFPEMRKYFLSGIYRKELNRQNPIGFQGHVAEAFAEVIEQLSKGMQSYAPRRFKQVVGRARSTFLGWGQQDSHEFVQFLLDGIHEDLNRVINKPTFETPDYKGGGEEEIFRLANTEESQYRSRNDSFMDDLFLFFFKNKLTCPDCHKVSFKFYPEKFLPLSLPTQKWKGWFYVVPINPSRPRYKVHLEAAERTTFLEAKKMIGEKVGIDGNNLAAFEVYNHKFFKEKYDSESVGDVTSRDDMIVFYEVASNYSQIRGPSDQTSENIIVPVFNTLRPSKNQNGKSRITYGGFGRNRLDYFGAPFLLSLSPEDVKDAKRIRKLISIQYSRYCLDPDDLSNEIDEQQDEEKQSIESGPDSESGEAADYSKQSVFNVLVSKRPTRLRKVYADSQGYDMDDVVPILESVIDDDKSKEDGYLPKRRAARALPGGFSNSIIDDEEDIYNMDDEGVNGNADEPEKQDETRDGQDMEIDSQENIKVETELKPAKPLIDSGYSIVCSWAPAAAKSLFGTDLKGKFEEIEEMGCTELGKGKNKNSYTLDDLFELFTQETILEDSEAWYCPSCKEHKNACKKMDLWSAPDTLVIMLKRYANIYRKVTDYVDFPLTGMDLTDKVHKRQTLERLIEKDPENEEYANAIEKENVIYDLFGVVNHSGGLGGGHYTADCKNLEDDKWYHFNDSFVSPISNPEDVKTSSAYVLFYRRRTSHALGGKTMDIVNAALEQAKLVILETPMEGTDSTSPLPDGDTKDNDMNGLQPIGLSTIARRQDAPSSPDLSDDGAEAGSDDSSENWAEQVVQLKPQPRTKLPDWGTEEESAWNPIPNLGERTFNIEGEDIAIGSDENRTAHPTDGTETKSPSGE